jgi:hypothetical protein
MLRHSKRICKRLSLTYPQLSNYWTANVYFKARNGTYKRVPQIPNRDLFSDKYTGKTTGGFVVYYVSPGKDKVTAFKPVSITFKERRLE